MADTSLLDSFTTSDGCAIRFRARRAEVPDAHRLALIHPLALNGTVWDQVASQLNGQVSLLTYDCRGHGRSDRLVETYTTELFARDLSELLGHIGWDTASVAGCSMGGCVAQAFAGLFPEKLEALALIDTTAFYGPTAVADWEERAAQVKSEGLGSRIESQATRWFGDNFRERHPEIVEQMIDVFLDNDIACYEAACRMLGTADLRRFQNAIDVPVSIIVGEDDFATPVAMSRQLHDSIAESTLKILPRARHLTPVECPGEIAQELLQLLERS